MVVSDNLIQVFFAYTILFINLMARLHLNLRHEPFWFMIIFFYLINCGIALQMVTSILGNCKTIFNERWEMTVERDCFKDILDNFNEGILIVSGDPPPDSSPSKVSFSAAEKHLTTLE